MTIDLFANNGERDEADEVAQRLATARNLVESLENDLSFSEEEKRAYHAEIYAAQQKIIEAQAKIKAIDTNTFDKRRDLRNARAAVESEERQLNQALDNRLMREHFQSALSEFDQIIKTIEGYKNAMQHQIEGAKRMAYSKRAILADTMGLGKTLTSLITADLNKVDRVLVIAPNTVVRSFENEIKRWAPHRTLVSLAGITRNERRFVAKILEHADEFIVTINYEAWRKDQESLDILAKAKFQMVICDEAHVIKDINSIAYRGVEKIVFAENLIPGDPGFEYELYGACSVKYVLPMTGTPILNKPQEIFPLLRLCDRLQFEREYQFLNDYCEKDVNTGRWNFQFGGMDRLSRRIASRFLRRTKDTAGIKLPPKTIMVHELELDPDTHPEQFRACSELNDYAAIMLDEENALTVSAMIALITRKRQAITWPAGIELKHPKTKEVVLKVDIEESVKIDAAMDLLDEVISDEKVVIFSQFKAPLRELDRRIRALGYSVATIDGDTNVDERATIIEKFQSLPLHSPDGVDIILGNYKALGVGVTLTAATQMIILDEEWNPGKNEQAYDRIYRIGQEKPVTINILRVKNSIDTWMAALNQEKADMVDGFINNTDMQQRLREAILSGEVL